MDSKSKEVVLEEIAKSNFDADFDTVMNWGGKELRELIHHAMDAWHTQQSAADKERIKELETALLEIKRDIYENDVCDVISIIDSALNKEQWKNR